MKIYTRAGDDGSTGLLGGGRVRKDILRLETCGTVDELNASLGQLLSQLTDAATTVRPWIETIQSDLFIVGALLATPPSDTKQRAQIPSSRVPALEEQIDKMEEVLVPLAHFILPQGSPAAATAHFARAICRRAERRLVALAAQERVDRDILPYLNRLSDFLFVAARWISLQEGAPETAWHYDADKGARLEKGVSAARDRMDLNLKKLDQEKELRKTLFEKAASDLARKKEQAQRLFNQKVDEAKKHEGPVEKPFRDMDLD